MFTGRAKKASRMITETEYRMKIQATLERLEKAFDGVDPDIAEASIQFGALTIVYGGTHKCILSAQPSVRQLWLALASQGTAVHFNWDAAQEKWLDDKGLSIEVIQYLRDFFKKTIGQELPL